MSKAKNIPALRFPEFGGEWEEKSVGNICSMRAGKFTSASEIHDQYGDGLYPCYGGNGLRGYTRTYTNTGKYPLIGRQGALCGNIKLAVGLFYATEHALVVTAKKDIQVEWLFYQLGRLNLNRYATGQAQPGLSVEVLEKVASITPAEPQEQKKIADFLTAIDKKLQALKKKKVLLEQYKKGVMQKIFSGELRFKDENGNDFADWEVKKLMEMAEIFDGTHQTPTYLESGVPFYSVEHLTSNDFSNTKFISEDVFNKENKKVKIEKGDILMTRIGDIGTSKYIDWEVNASFYVSLALIKQSPKYDSQYLNQYISNDNFKGELWRRTIHVAFPKKINLGEIGQCLIATPSILEQQKIANFLTAIGKKINQQQSQIEKVSQYKKGLLQQMFC